eukprot:TRINITY_DN3550_c0_g1_i1.p1 TRINITY_DN3550_c0_g1~~TRINITY_DN3550_c0_g1_i1.p1  ORF type:complete len:431 (+),score=66.73 TRINITY_DN3550_c0_g1_i1:3-1295(+)
MFQHCQGRRQWSASVKAEDAKKNSDAQSPLAMLKHVVKLMATCPRGTERALKHELLVLGIDNSTAVNGGVRFSAELRKIAALNVQSRIASRILLEVATFPAKAGDEIVQALAKVEFEDILTPQTTFAVDSYVVEPSADWIHSVYASQKVKDVICDRLREKGLARPNVDSDNPDVRFVLHWGQGTATLTRDTSGSLLFRRGYRQKDAPAPLKENLAAGMLALGFADVLRPFIDPCCGSGTLGIEQAMRALKIAPGANKTFAFEKWHDMPKELRKEANAARQEAKAGQLTRLPAPIVISDFWRETLEVTKRSVEAAGLAAHIHIEKADARKRSYPAHAVIATNLPFGVRIGEKNMQLDGLYRGLGEAWHNLDDTRVLALSAYPNAERLLDLGTPVKRWHLRTGDVRPTLFRWDIKQKSEKSNKGDSSGSESE